MHSFLTRLRNRNRAINQSSTQSAPPTTLQHDSHDAPNVLPPIDRKIRPDINALLEAYAAEDATDHHVHASTEVSSVKEMLGPSPLKPRSSGRVLRKKEIHETPAYPTLSSTWERSSVPHVSQAPPRSGTFGRHSQNLLVSAPTSTFHSLPSRIRPSDGKENDRSLPIPVWKRRPSTAPSPQNRVVGLPETPSFDFSEHAETDPSFKTSARSHSSSTKTHSSRSSKSRSARISTPVANQLGFDSPRTFGYPTPSSTRATGHRVAGSPPPPLPPLIHPEYNAHATMSQSSTFGKPVRPYSSLPKVNSFFLSSSSEQGFGDRYSHRRANTMSSTSTKASRRSSAEWSANQAIGGILTNSGSWPAEVAREIIRSSFPGSHDSHQDPSTKTRGSHVADVPSARTFPQTSVLSSSLGPTVIQSVEPAPGPLDLVGDHVVIGEDSERMGEYDKKAPDASSSQLGPTARGKTPLKKSSLRMSSSPVSLASTSHSSGPFISFAGVTAELLASESHSKPSNSMGSGAKRKADEVDVIPQDQKRAHAKFAVTEERLRHGSLDPHAPSSYRVKRARLSGSTPNPSPSRPGTSSDAANTSSRANSPNSSVTRQQLGSRSGSVRSTPVGSERTRSPNRPRSTSSLSHASIPLSALVSPHAPSVSRSLNNTYHMRDPRKPAKIQSTQWGLRFRSEDENGSPIHAWFFFFGFVVFPIWWVASVWRIPKTRQLVAEDMEKTVMLDDPQVEHDAKSWRFRCRIMVVVSIFTYIPFIVLVAIFVPR